MSSRDAEKQRILRWSAEFHAKRNVKKEREEADNKRSSSAIIMPPPPYVVRESRRDDDGCGRRDRSNIKSRRGREDDHHVKRRHSRSGERPTTYDIEVPLDTKEEGGVALFEFECCTATAYFQEYTAYDS